MLHKSAVVSSNIRKVKLLFQMDLEQSDSSEGENVPDMRDILVDPYR